MRVGADTEELRAFCGLLRRSAQCINDALADTRRLSNDLAWHGNDAEEFRRLASRFLGVGSRLGPVFTAPPHPVTAALT